MNRRFLPLGFALCLMMTFWLLTTPGAHAQTAIPTVTVTDTATLPTFTSVTVTAGLAEDVQDVLASTVYTVEQVHLDPCMSPCSVIFYASHQADWKIYNNGAVTEVANRQRFAYIFEGPPSFYSLQYEATFSNGRTVKGLPFKLQMIAPPQFSQTVYTCLVNGPCRLSLRFDAPLSVGPYTVDVSGATFFSSQLVDPQHLDVWLTMGAVPTQLTPVVTFAMPPFTRVSMQTKINVVRVQIVLSLPLIVTAPVAGQ